MALSGGVFQNEMLLEDIKRSLTGGPLTHLDKSRTFRQTMEASAWDRPHSPRLRQFEKTDA